MGVTTKKNINPIMSGDINLLRRIPNLYQILFKGDNNLELKIPNIKNKAAITKDHNLMLSLFKIGYKPINKKRIKNTIPKDLFEPIFIFLFDILKVL